MKYNPSKIEKKWQQFWLDKKLYSSKDSVKNKVNYLLLTEFPYPSGNLHIGHWYAFALPDISSRYLRMKGYNVMYPIGFDAFGLPAENAAIKNNINPRDWTQKNIKYMTKQLRSMGATFDWDRAVSTIDPEYYKWTQWMFLKMYEKGLAYRAKTLVNWCPVDKTVLANEQVQDGCCERCDAPVVKKELEQWMFRITDYAERLINDLQGLDWPETTKLAQKNWIGRSEGALIRFRLLGLRDKFVEVFTTRPDTLFGATYMVLGPEHELISKIKNQISNIKEVEKYAKKAKAKTNEERIAEGKPSLAKAMESKGKTGVELKGIKAINPANKEEIPVWVADYVLGHVGTGAIMAVPAHDQRDFEFARKFNLPIKIVICPHYPQLTCPILDQAYDGKGHLVDSGRLSGMPSDKAKDEIIKFVGGEKKIQYRLHDWVISRQRFWGVPIPMVNCKKCNWQPVSEKDLPLKLPPLKDFMPVDDGRSPLAKAEKWARVKCPNCNEWAERETDTMDTFVDSSWYFIRYIDPQNKNKFADEDKMKLWLPVPLYIGGSEHNTMHLLYSRFFTKVLYDLGFVDFSEPFIGRRNHGIILGPDSQKMSKSRGNVIDPDKEVAKYGADAVRMYLAFMGPYDQGGPWNPGGINGIYRFLNRVWNFTHAVILRPKAEGSKKIDSSPAPLQKGLGQNDLNRAVHKTIKKVTEDIEGLRYNTAISALMILLNEFESGKWLRPEARPLGKVESGHVKTLLLLLAPFAPHLTEELWQQLHEIADKRGQIADSRGKGLPLSASSQQLSASIHLEKWPEYDPKLIQEETFELVAQINGKIRDIIEVKIGISEKEAIDIVSNLNQVKKYLEGKSPQKVIFVPNRLINFVIDR